MSYYSETLDRIALPVVALRGLVVFPGIDTSFEVARPQTVKAVEMALKAEGVLFLVTQKDAAVEVPEPSDLYKIGVVARIKQSVKLPDRSYRIICDTLSRAESRGYFRLSEGQLTAEVIEKQVRMIDSLTEDASCRSIVSSLEELSGYLPKLSPDVANAVQTIDNIGFLADFVASNVLRRTEDKMRILEEFDPSKRAEILKEILEREIAVAKIEARLNQKVRRHLDEQQREAFLREQLRVIQGELGGESADPEEADLLARIADAPLPDEIREKLSAQAKKLHQMPFGSSESALIRNYVETCLELPWNQYTDDCVDPEKARKILDRDHDGLEKVKERIIEYLAAAKLRGKAQGQILCLVGAPGVGKTSVASSIAEALGRNYVRVSLGGVRDEADVRGHRKTYIGAMPGRIVNALIQAKSMNPLITKSEAKRS